MDLQSLRKRPTSLRIGCLAASVLVTLSSCAAHDAALHSPDASAPDDATPDDSGLPGDVGPVDAETDACPCDAGGRQPDAEAEAPVADWLALVNDFRSTAHLPRLHEEPAFSEGDALHARYIVENDVLEHSEDPTNPWYTPDGDQAARNGNLHSSPRADADFFEAIDGWMAGPFHALGILDPRLVRTGFGEYREMNGGFIYGAVLDVVRGRDLPAEAAEVPVMWPADGSTVPLRAYWGDETPDPLSPCPGYQPPSGLPILLLLGPSHRAPVVTGHAVTQDDRPLDHCVFGPTTYTSGQPDWQDVARRVLASRGAIVVVPRTPLEVGSTSRVSIVVDGRKYDWTFHVAPQTRDYPSRH